MTALRAILAGAVPVHLVPGDNAALATAVGVADTVGPTAAVQAAGPSLPRDAAAGGWVNDR